MCTTPGILFDMKIEVQNSLRAHKAHTKDFQAIKDYYLGKDYELSLVFCGERLMRRINRETRGKDYATNVLSFPLSDTSGEMFICLPICKKQYKKFGRTYPNFIAFLFVHGIVHLAGYDHGDTMDNEESKLYKRFSI